MALRLCALCNIYTQKNGSDWPLSLTVLIGLYLERINSDILVKGIFNLVTEHKSEYFGSLNGWFCFMG